MEFEKISQGKLSISAEEFKNAAEPILKLLYEKGCPHKTAIISTTCIKIVSDELGILLEFKD